MVTQAAIGAMRAMIQGEDAEAMRLASVVAEAVLGQEAVRLALAVREGGLEARMRAADLCEAILQAATAQGAREPSM